MSDLDYVIPDDGFDVAENNEPSTEIDHVQTGLDRLYFQFKKEKIHLLVVVLMEPVQEAEEMLQVVLTQRDPLTAVGRNLDVVGSRVGQSRTSADDEIYRRHVLARIATNKSKGTIADVIKITRAVLNDADSVITITQHYPGSIIVSVVSDEDVADILHLFLQAGVSAGVRVLVEWSGPDAEAFTFENGPGLGLGDSTDAGVGGEFAGVTG